MLDNKIHYFLYPGCQNGTIPKYTTSLDAVFKLMPEKYFWSRHLGANNKMTMVLNVPGYYTAMGQGATPAMELLTAYFNLRKYETDD